MAGRMRGRTARCNRTTADDEMVVDASQNAFESGLKPLWLRAQSGDEAAYRDCLLRIAARLRAFLRRRMQGLPDEVEDLV